MSRFLKVQKYLVNEKAAITADDNEKEQQNGYTATLLKIIDKLFLTKVNFWWFKLWPKKRFFYLFKRFSFFSKVFY
jgi:hypothetical protein